MKKLITLILALTMLLALGACSKGNDNGGNNSSNDSTPVSEIMDKLVASIPDDSRPGGLQTIALESEDSYSKGEFAESSGMSFSEAFQFLTGLTYEDGFEAAVNQSMMGAIPYDVVLVRVPAGKDANKVAEDLKANNDPGKWICVCADTVETRVKGNLVLFAMVNKEENEHGPVIDAIIKSFEAL